MCIPLKSSCSYLTILFLFFFASSFSEKNEWSKLAPFNEEVWIQNNGEFANLVPDITDTVLFYTRNEGVITYLTPTTLSYVYIEQVIDDALYETWGRREHRKGQAPSEPKIDKSKIAKHIKHLFAWEWVGANRTPAIVTLQSQKQYYINHNPSRKITTKSNCYKKIILENIYPNIDIEYIVGNKGRVKYNVVVHAGASIANIKLVQHGFDKPRLTTSGQAEYKSPVGVFIHDVPYTYNIKSKKKIYSSYKLVNDTLSFLVESYNREQDIVIDPWVSNPLFPNQNEVYDVAADSAGNVWAYGSNLFKVLKKYDVNGNLLWTLSTNTLGYAGVKGLGDIDVDKGGSCYMSENNVYYKIDALGNVVYGPIFSPVGAQGESFFRMRLSSDEKSVFGFGAANYGNIYKYKSYNGNQSLDCITGNLNTPELRAAVVSPSGKIFSVSTNSIVNVPSARIAIFNKDGNYIKDIPTKGIYPYHSGNGNATYINTLYFFMHNGIAANCTQLCVFDGDTLAKYDTSGTFINYTTVNQAVQGAVLAFDTVKSSGLLMDNCNNTFLGTIWGIQQYDNALNFVTLIPTTGAVFDMDWLQNGSIAAGGENFVGVFSNPSACAALYCVPDIDTSVVFSYTVFPEGCSSNSGKISFDVNSAMPFYYIITGNDTAAPIYYHVTPGSTTSLSDSILNLPAGTYQIEVGVSASQSFICIPKSYSYLITIEKSDSLVASISSSGSVCGNACNGILTGTVVAGAPPYQFSWSNGETSSVSTNLCAGTYSLQVVDNKGCTTTVISTITASPSFSVTLDANKTESCGPACVTFTAATNPYGVGVNYVWKLDNGSAVSSTIDTSSKCYTSVGNYCPTVTVSNSLGCSVSAKLQDTIRINDTPTSHFIVLPSEITALNPTVQCENLSTGYSNLVWNFNDPNNANAVYANVENPMHSYSDTGTYCITQVAYAENGCVDSSFMCIVIQPDFTFYAPNSFTPNGDGVNDFLGVHGIGIAEFQLSVFDRWGSEIFTTGKVSSISLALPWDGKANNGSKIAQQDIYVWQCSITDVFDVKHSYTGHVALIR
ncbi:MAG: gliding motility-associated C-terminal domain-containing protein [Bacteroidetes bacterium]|nr:gliding motility-associated C-terminal domain-containing protein [Bacteroidota bacterium]